MSPNRIVRLSIVSGIAMAALFGFAACSQGTGPGSTKVGDNTAKLVVVNGVQCVVMDGYRSGGISCNWDAYNQGRVK